MASCDLLQHPFDFVERLLLGWQTVSTHHQQLIQQSFTLSPRGLVFNPRLLLWMRHGYVIERPISAHAHTEHRGKKVEKASTLFNIRYNERNVEWFLKQRLNAFKLI